METTELMRKDWVRLSGVRVYCQVDRINPDSVSGVTASGGFFEQNISKIVPITLDRDILLRTSFWLVSGTNSFRKVVRGVAGFEYDVSRRRLEVFVEGLEQPNLHYGVESLHQLQHLFKQYTNGNELEVNILHNKRKDYNQRIRNKQI